MKNVIGQTGRSRILLSDDAVNRKVTQKRTVRYQYQKVQSGWIAWVCGPFHSRTYGVCGFGTMKRTAKATLQRNLADNYGYLGRLIFSDIDSANDVRLIGLRVRSDYAVQPIAIGSADG
jgi:hypothetical protein